ncbi:MAG: DMT family transporter [Lachnospiraceae bacterium]|nr:DMT family transporter [Lachnospiraceae bacterium]
MKNKNKAIIYVLCSALGFAFMNLFVKLAGDLPFMQKCFFRNFVAMFFAFGIMLKQRVPFKQSKEGMKHVWLRSIFGGLGMLCNFYAIDRLVIADASMLNKLSPFFAIIFSVFLIKEKPKFYQLLCVIVAFVGAVFILKPGMEGLISFPAFVGMLGGAGAGFAYTNVRLATAKGVDKPFIVVFFSAFTCLLCLPGLIITFVPMSGFQWFCMIMTGASATVGQMGITTAYSLAKASEISVYDYSMIIFAAILGMLFLKEVPDVFSVVGYVIIIGAGVVMFLLNNRKEKQQVT